MNRFIIHGSRGTSPISGDGFIRYGGRTTCFSLEMDEGVIVVDAGTGIVGLAAALAKRDPATSFTFLFTHFHTDHVMGLPLCPALFNPAAHVTLVGDDNRAEDWRSSLNIITSPPFWPIKLSQLGAQISFEGLPGGVDSGFVKGLDARSGEMNLYGAEVSWLPVRHPQQCLAFRIRTDDFSVVIATDREHGDSGLDEHFLNFAHQADFLVHDAQYTPAEQPERVGWGHSTWHEAAEVAKKADVRKLILTHHDFMRIDRDIDDIILKTAEIFPSVAGAYDGMTLTGCS